MEVDLAAFTRQMQHDMTTTNAARLEEREREPTPLPPHVAHTGSPSGSELESADMAIEGDESSSEAIQLLGKRIQVVIFSATLC